MSSERVKFNENDLYRVRKNTRLNEALYLSKVVLKKHGTIQIEGMGECISMVAKLSQILSKDKLAKIESIKADNVDG